MMDAETISFIRKEIRKQVNIILYGLAGTNDSQTEDVVSLFPGTPPIPAAPVMHPFGIVSRAPENTTQVVGKIGDHPFNRVVMGHRDMNRPSVNSGEVQLYNQFGQAIYLQNGTIHIGTAAANDPVPVGTELLSFLTSFMEAYISHTHIGNLGAPTPLSSGDVTTANNLKAENLDNKNILSNYIFVDKG